MKKFDLTQAIQILANVGVLASVVFLALEIRGNTVAFEQQEIGALLDQDQNLLFATVDEEIGRLYSKSLFEPTELTRGELARITSLLSVRLSILRRIYLAYRNGVVSEAEWQFQVGSIPIYLGSPFGRLWWDSIKPDYAAMPDFVAAVEDSLATSEIVPDDEWLLEFEARVRTLDP
jgi:hypothetical protein